MTNFDPGLFNNSFPPRVLSLRGISIKLYQHFSRFFMYFFNELENLNALRPKSKKHPVREVIEAFLAEMRFLEMNNS